jgi:hypothetical protein
LFETLESFDVVRKGNLVARWKAVFVDSSANRHIEELRISMADIGLSLPIVENTSSPERKILEELIRISMVNIALLRFVSDDTGIPGGSSVVGTGMAVCRIHAQEL